MKRAVIGVILRTCGEAVLLAVIAAILVGVLGYLSKWETSRPYSNAFFIAGALIFLACASSRLGTAQYWNSFQLISSESFRGMSTSERANYIVNASSSFRLVILGLLSGIVLCAVSELVAKLF